MTPLFATTAATVFAAPAHPPETYAAFLRTQLPRQTGNVVPYELDGERVWLKKAGTPHSIWRYRLLGLAARTLRLAALQPVPNPGGQQAIATEVRRLRTLHALGLRVPQVLAAEPEGFLMQNLATRGTLIDEMDAARDPQAILTIWQQGLQALAQVHAAGACLSQAFARNMVRCSDGVVGFLDFEEDPAAVLPLPLCQARDALHYAHSCAIYLVESGALGAGHALWADWLAHSSPAMQAALQTDLPRLHWLRLLPPSRSLGRDLQRVRAAYDLLTYGAAKSTSAGS
ncbi:hypothetical protein [Extensimonas vulgaris]|uniref:tRNA A-37 threonylcarbamoyl transferase component Bud32 n=1 Tax=Extensimonas vulgaris TaxID=1031594 RepID=A0A369ANK1_9BURK|nr:hypothetical protein [Extensimonas vulgaris]RCX10655.1 hypothetical protein DFR45_10256 [Extensimonas vulgaris]TWI41297.1 hypothetical protein IP95_00054 [Extensimonas vulgaris]TXD16769.1 hypothetical protein FUT63_01905 [Extensimonas vulgaris]